MTFLALALLVVPLAAAQQAGKSYRIGFLALVPGEDTTLMKALLDRLHELGYGEGKNLTFAYRSADGHPEWLPRLAAELVQARPDVLITGFGTLAAQAAKAATTTIPIVFTNVGDPVGAGLVASLGQPGGNITGLTDQARDLGGKRLEFLRELIPGKQRIAVLMNPDTPFSRLALKDLTTAAEGAHTHLEILEARTADDISGRFEAAIRAGASGLMVFEDPLTYSARRHIADLAVKYRLPTVYGYRDFAEAGGLIAYGSDRRQMYRRAAEYADRILNGARPAALPVEQPTKFELIINMKAARALGLSIPPSLLLRADQVIE
jgi:ABC-type uncharacterized transport system substrate-binding protein